MMVILCIVMVMVQDRAMTLFPAGSPPRMTISDVFCSGVDTFDIHHIDDDDDYDRVSV